MSAADDALDVARFCWPEHEWYARDCDAWRPQEGCSIGQFWPHWGTLLVEAHIAAAERVLVERGMGEEYGRALLDEMGLWRGISMLNYAELAAVRTAPLEVCLRALALVVREKQQKETK